ncbi:hypothetical protein [uncultured Spirosoma sp.]|uniref:hypothetical protein n=1 Tax=uncultured Spirosoma sp. TaxID=278208 RepID=UPI00258E949F|nr:hypothetical protein [uncultured Spirosoma sp.]
MTQPFSRSMSWRLLLMLCLAEPLLSQAQIGFQVSPAKLYFNRASADNQPLRLHITNPMDTRLVLQATCADWRRDSVGEKVYYPPGTLPTSGCSLFKVIPDVIELAPGEKRDVLVSLIPNQQAPTGAIQNAMLLLTQSNEQEVARQKGTSQFIIKAQIGVHVYVLPNDHTEPEVAITGMSLTQATRPYQVNVKIHNTGKALLESQLRMEYLNMSTMEEVKTEAVPVNTMPDEAFRVTTNVPPNLSAGKYLIVAVLDSGPGQALKVAELETVLK